MTAPFQIPTVDLHGLRVFRADRVDKCLHFPSILEQVKTGLEQGDFLYLRNIGILSGDGSFHRCVLNACESAGQLFCAEEATLEERYGFPEILRQRGYSPPGGEQAVGSDTPDKYRQFWMLGNAEEHGLGSDPEDWKYDKHDIDPSGLSADFGRWNRLVFRRLLTAGRVVLACMEKIYGLEPGRLTEMSLGSDSVLRTLCYRTDLPEGTILAAEHTDINLVTLLASPNMSGLELQIDGEWVPFETRASSGKVDVLFNIGEMLTQIPELEHLKMVRHRVVAVPGAANPRIQLACFIHAKRATEFRPGIVCGPWFKQRIAEITKK